MDRNRCDGIEIKPVRSIRPTRRSLSGVYAFRGDTAVPYESSLERDFLLRLEFFLDVADVIPQPVEIPFSTSSGRTFSYTPDFLIFFKLGSRSYEDYPKPLLIEVKPEAQWRLHWREWSAKWKAARRHAIEQGWFFRVLDESRIRDQAFHNIKFLERYARMQFPEEESRQVIETIRQMGSAPMHYILARHFMGHYKAQGIAHVWHLVAQRRLECDIHQKVLNQDTQLWVPGHE